MKAKPCPFCGSEDTGRDENSRCGTFHISCHNCGATGPGVDYMKPHEYVRALTLWNVRTHRISESDWLNGQVDIVDVILGADHGDKIAVDDEGIVECVEAGITRFGPEKRLEVIFVPQATNEQIQGVPTEPSVVPQEST